MIGDAARIRAYASALRQAIKPHSTVLDIGTGAGIFALLACQLGARRVIAVEPDDVIELARGLAAANGFADRIEFIQDVSANVTLAEPADIVVSDLRGALPLRRQHIPTVIDARTRLLVPGGVLIPLRDRVWATVVEDTASTRSLEGWRELPGLDMEIARRLASNTWWRIRLIPDQLLAQPRCWATLDYRTVEDANVGGSFDLAITRSGTGHGLGLWFDAILAEGVSLSGAPGEAELIYRHAFFPFSEPLSLAPGDKVSVVLQASLIGSEYVWRWETTASAQGDPERVIASFAQSTVHGVFPAQFRRVVATHVPTVNEQGRLDAVILSRMCDGIPLEQIARQVSAEFPGRFRAWDDAFEYVAGLSARYSR
jgi:protein arginine N-methyltransferase 1